MVSDSPAQETEYGQPTGLKEAEEKDRDCEKTEKELDDREEMEEEQAAEEAQTSEALVQEQQSSEPCPAEQTEGDFQREEEQEEMPRCTKEDIKGCEL